MAELTGGDLYLLFNGTVLDTDYRSFEDSEEMGLVDASAGNDSNRSYLTLLKDGTATATILVQSEDTTTWDAVVPGAEGSLEWGEEGSNSGKPRHYVNAIVQERVKSMEYDDLIVGDLSWQYSGSVTDTTY